MYDIRCVEEIEGLLTWLLGLILLGKLGNEEIGEGLGLLWDEVRSDHSLRLGDSCCKSVMSSPWYLCGDDEVRILRGNDALAMTN